MFPSRTRGSLHAAIKTIIVTCSGADRPARPGPADRRRYDGTSVEAILSTKEPTRIRIDGAPITDVFGNIHSSHCNSRRFPPRWNGGADRLHGQTANPAGELKSATSATRARSTFARSAIPSPINLFVSSANFTYTLLLRRSDTPADTIVIRDKTPKVLKAGMSTQASAGAAPNPVRAMKGAAGGHGVGPRAARYPV